MEKNSASDRPKASPILIVDDEISLAKTLAAFVMDLGYSSETAYNGQEALALVRQCWPALVITDQTMPLMNGTDLIRALSTEATAHKTIPPPVVLISGTAVLDLAGVHIDARLTKPFDLDELESVIHLLCGEASSGQSFHTPPR